MFGVDKDAIKQAFAEFEANLAEIAELRSAPAAIRESPITDARLTNLEDFVKKLRAAIS